MDFIRILTEFTEVLWSFEHLQSLWNVWNVQCFPSLVLHYVKGKFPTAFLFFLKFLILFLNFLLYSFCDIFRETPDKDFMEATTKGHYGQPLVFDQNWSKIDGL